MPDPRPPLQRVQDSIEECRLNRKVETESLSFGLIAVAQAILATANTEPPTIERLGHFIPIDAWSEFAITFRIDEADCSEYQVRSVTLNKILESFDDMAKAIEYRDHMIRSYSKVEQ